MQNIEAKELASMEDKELAMLLKGGNDGAFDEIVRRFQGRVYAAAYRVTGNREDALDVAQDALIKVYKKIDLWQPTGGFLSWVLRIATNQAFDHLRRKKRRHQEQLEENVLNESEGAPVEPAAFDTGAEVRAREIEDRIRDTLVALSPMQRKVFVMRHFEGFPLADIAEELQCTVGSVKVHLFRAVKKVREGLRELRPDL